jgi:hypothetical protein
LAVLTDGREGLLLDGGGAEFDTIKDAGVEDIETSIDAVADEFNRFLDEAVDAACLAGFVHHNTVFGGLFNLGDDDRALIPVLFVKSRQLFEWVIADDVRVEHEERRIVLPEDLLCEFEGASCPQRFGFNGELDLDVILLLVLQEQTEL